IAWFEALGLLAVSAALAVARRRRFPIPESARLPLLLLLALLAFNHVANILEQLGATWADSVADDLAMATPLVWGLFLVEVGRSFLQRQVDVHADQLHFLVERVPASVAWLDAELRVQAVSRVWESQFPNSCGHPLREVMPAQLSELTRAIDECLHAGPAEKHGEDQSRDSAGRLRYYRWALRRVDPAEEGRVGALLILEETTEAVEAEAERALAAEQLASTQRAADLGQLAAGAAHDLNNMLQVIHNANEELSELPGAALASSDIRQAVQSACAMTRTLLRLGVQKKQTLTPLDLTALLAQVEGLLKIALGRKHRLIVQKPRQPILIAGDADRLEHAILNLVVNARDASPAGGSIYLTLEVIEGVARLTVKDEGEGIPLEIQGQLFRPFFTTKGARGTGLGLVSVRSTVTQHGGTVTVQSWPGAGSEFEMRIPLTRAHALESTLPPSASCSD
ncbi:MAG TPA: ATP-binding protein, partial [Polyangiaceae bacterium]|nr:ATP-binding protein [Polyangiaceae bacterium]